MVNYNENVKKKCSYSYLQDSNENKGTENTKTDYESTPV